MSHLATLLTSLLSYEVRSVLYWFEAALICLLILAALAGCIICIWYFIEFILDGEKKGALFLGTLALVLGFFCVLFISEFPKAPKNPNTINPQAVEALKNLKNHHSTSYDDDYESSSSSSSSSGSSSGGSIWSQPQPQYNNQQNYSGSSYENQSQEHHKSWHNEEYETSCDFCYGSGKCQTCNGDGWVVVMGIGENHYCVNCHNHDGRCTHCNGTGRVTKINRSYY